MPYTFDQVSEQPTLLLSQRPYLPYGDAVVVYGEGSLGKGRSIASVIGAVTTGRPVGLDTDADDPGDAIVLLPEDKPGEQVVGRLIAAGADLRRVHDLTRVDGTRFKFSANPRTPGDLPYLRSYIELLRRSCLCGQVLDNAAALAAHLQESAGKSGTGSAGACAARNPRLVVCDPVTALVGDGTIQTNKGGRAFIEPLQDLADATGVCVVLVMHPTKNGKLQGSGALRDAARVVLKMSWDEVSKDQRVVIVEKGNNVPPDLAVPVRFTIKVNAEGRPYAEWLGKPGTAEPGGGPGWREERETEKAARAACAAKAAVASVTLPAVPPSAALPWRAIRWDRAAGKADAQSHTGDAATEDAARALAVTAAGRPLAWSPYGSPGQPSGVLSSPVRRADGTVTIFAVYQPGKPVSVSSAA